MDAPSPTESGADHALVREKTRMTQKRDVVILNANVRTVDDHDFVAIVQPCFSTRFGS
jgi:hypothetical protein